uniref:F-box domain-containing protein n=1 Tax=Syphacia muris TaxID=451379 RepID=A0A158R6A8_9BILA
MKSAPNQDSRKKYINEAPPVKDRKIENVEKLLLKSADHKQIALLDLPLLALSNIISHLSFKDQANFEKTCSLMRRAVKFFWKSQRSFDYEEYTVRLFKMKKDTNRYPLAYHHVALQRLPNVLSLYQNCGIQNISLRTLPLLTTDDLDTIVMNTTKTTAELFGSVRNLDLSDVCLNYEELQWFSRACPLISSLKLTFNAVAMDTFPNKEGERNEKNLNKLLSSYIRNYTVEIKEKNYPYQYLQLLVSVHDLFPCLGELTTFYVAAAGCAWSCVEEYCDEGNETHSLQTKQAHTATRTSVYAFGYGIVDLEFRISIVVRFQAA